MERRTAYIYDNTARQLYAEPVRRELPKQEPRKQPQTRPQPKKRVDKVAVMVALLTLGISFFVCFSYISKQFEITYLSKNVASLESQVLELQKQNDEAANCLDTTVNLTEIYRKATKELGMVQADNSQIFTYKSEKSNQVRQHGDIPG